MPRLAALSIAAALALTGPARSAETIVAGSVSSGSTNLWPVEVGIGKGMFAAEGAKIDLVFAQSNASVIQQLAANSINISVSSGLVDPIRAIERGAPVAILRIETTRPPYALLAKPAIRTLSGLRGRTVSIGGAKDITRIFFERMLAPSGVKPGEVDLIFAGATSARFAALQSGAADAAMLISPYNFHAEAEGYANLGLAADLIDMPFSGVAVNRNWAARNTATVEKYLAVYDRAIRWLVDPANRAEAIRLMIGASHLPADDVEKSYDFLMRGNFFDTTGTVSRRKLGQVVEALQQLGDLPKTMPLDRLFMPGLTRVSD